MPVQTLKVVAMQPENERRKWRRTGRAERGEANRNKKKFFF